MRQTILLLLFVIPLTVFSQFNDDEFYVFTKFGVGMAMSQYSYAYYPNTTTQDAPNTLKIPVGSGYVPEISLGFKLIKGFYFESSVSYVFNQDYYDTPNGNQTLTQGYSFNRLCFGFNGKYFVEISDVFLLDFSAGITYRIPQNLQVTVSNVEQTMQYEGSLGGQLGFGGSYVFNKLVLNGGIRYRYETYYLKTKQALPQDFLILNSQFEKIEANGIDVVISAFYNF